MYFGVVERINNRTRFVGLLEGKNQKECEQKLKVINKNKSKKYILEGYGFTRGGSILWRNRI